jgi:membrane-bound ClpP family serine protease
VTQVTSPLTELPPNEGVNVIVLGVVLLIIGFIAHVGIIWTLGIILVVIGAVLALLGTTGRQVGGRAHWY